MKSAVVSLNPNTAQIYKITNKTVTKLSVYDNLAAIVMRVTWDSYQDPLQHTIFIFTLGLPRLQAGQCKCMSESCSTVHQGDHWSTEKSPGPGSRSLLLSVAKTLFPSAAIASQPSQTSPDQTDRPLELTLTGRCNCAKQGINQPSPNFLVSPRNEARKRQSFPPL